MAGEIERALKAVVEPLRPGFLRNIKAIMVISNLAKFQADCTTTKKVAPQNVQEIPRPS